MWVRPGVSFESQGVVALVGSQVVKFALSEH